MIATSSIGAMVDRHRLVVVVGTGGVGKTTMAAALALGAALRGRRAMVLTIDPARALARSLGLATLAPGGEPVSLVACTTRTPGGHLDAGMLDQKQAWDSFVTRHAPSAAAARSILDNRFYQELSTSFAGATEYMAIEETCRLSESGRYDLVVLDTPPAVHALDFLRAPERLDPLLDHRVTALLTRPGAAAGAVARVVLGWLELAAGRIALAEVSAFLAALDTLLDDAVARTRKARELLRGGNAGFVLVTGPRQLVLDETSAFVERMRAVDAELAGVVLNRAHPAPAAAAPAVDAVFAALATLGAPGAPGDPAVAWARAAWADAAAEADAEAAPVQDFLAALPPAVPRAVVPEATRDVHTLADLATVAARLWD